MSDQYAVIGNPIGHTKSPLIHGMFAEATGQDIVYTAIEGRIGQFAEDAQAFRVAGGRGMNVTAPFKLDAFAFATERSPRASLAGAVNALKFDGERVLAENFDGVGLTRDVVENQGCAMRGKRVLILGAGGATRGALLPFLEQQPSELLELACGFTRRHDTAHWLAVCARLEIPAAPVARLDSLPQDPHLAQTGFFEQLQDEAMGTLRFPGVPVRFDGHRPAVAMPPRLGAHTRELLAEAGCSPAQIDAVMTPQPPAVPRRQHDATAVPTPTTP